MKTQIAALLVASLLLFGCLGSNGSVDTNTQLSSPTSGASAVPPAQQNVKEFTVEASQFQFNPSTITVSKGDLVRITLKAVDVGHGMGIPQFGFSLKADAGKTVTGEFTASKEGTYTFSCIVQCGEGHKEMKGTLIVQ